MPKYADNILLFETRKIVEPTTPLIPSRLYISPLTRPHQYYQPQPRSFYAFVFNNKVVTTLCLFFASLYYRTFCAYRWHNCVWLLTACREINLYQRLMHQQMFRIRHVLSYIVSYTQITDYIGNSGLQ